MKKLICLNLLIIVLSSPLFAQTIESWIDSKKPILFEKLYLQVDRDFYAPGDKIWMKVYQVNGITYKLNSNFRNIFVELIADDGRVVRDMVLFSVHGVAHGDFSTKKLPRGVYTIRATTKYLENFGEAACFHKKIWITNSAETVNLSKDALPDSSKMDIAFLPEGGTFVANAVNTLAFRAIDTKGRGIYVSGKIRDDRGDTLVRFTTSYRGMGKLVMMPVSGANYYATIDQFPEMKISLPKAVDNSICLNYKESGESLLFGMSANMKQTTHPGFYFVASHKGIVLFYKKIEMTDYSQTLNLSKSLFPKGISKISLLDTAFNVFAERLIFVDDGQNENIHISLNKTKFATRDSVNIALDALLAPGDSILTTLSASVVNKGYLASSSGGQTIRSYLLLDSELKGAIESPDSYFKNDEGLTSSEKLDLLMMVHGWKTYLWDDLENIPKPNLEDWNDAGINIRGFVKKLFSNAPVTGGKVVLGPAGGNFLFLETTSDSMGRFEFRQIYLRDSTMVMINAKTKNRSRNTEIRLDPVFKTDSVISPEILNPNVSGLDLNLKFLQENYYRRMKEMGYNPEKGSILLSEVDVVENRIPKDATQFRIYQEADNSFKITQADHTYNNVIEYLEGKVAGLTVSGDEISIRGGGTPLFLIDGVEVSDFPPGSGRVLQEIKSLHMSEIEKIDILKSGMNLAMYGLKGANGIIAIYRTSGDYTENIDRYIKGRITERIKGFNRPSKFYSPKYTLENRKDPTPDFRPTLFWEPNLVFKDGKATLRFFTSDEQAQFQVYVEGISKNGKICFGTTSFLVNKK